MWYVLTFFKLPSPPFSAPPQFTHIDMKKEESKFAMAALVDTKAGNWPSDSFKDLFEIADQCLEQKLHARKEMEGVSVFCSSWCC